MSNLLYNYEIVTDEMYFLKGIKTMKTLFYCLNIWNNSSALYNEKKLSLNGTLAIHFPKILSLCTLKQFRHM